jgi:hypothetical protein
MAKQLACGSKKIWMGMAAFALILAVDGGTLMATAASGQNSSNVKTVNFLFQECGGASGNVVAACTTASECNTNKASCAAGTTGYLKCTGNTCDCYKVFPDLFTSLNSNATESDKMPGNGWEAWHWLPSALL